MADGGEEVALSHVDLIGEKTKAIIGNLVSIRNPPFLASTNTDIVLPGSTRYFLHQA